MSRRYDRVKRGLDLAAALLGLLVLLPVLLLVAAAVAVSMGPPVLYRQRRPGRAGVAFTLVKFRTMRPADPALSGLAGLATDGARLTRLGRWLRATSLDELPTLWNVVRGDMSLIGPRPLMLEYLDRYTPQEARRHEVRPGITGLAQVRGRNALSWEAKFAHDVSYVDNRSLWLDLRILAETVWVVLRRHGVNTPAHPTATEFRPAQLQETR